MYNQEMKNTPDDKTIESWARLVRAGDAIQSRIEADLKAKGLPSLSWYDVLLELDRVGLAGMRPYELEEHLLLPQYGLSRLIDRIEKAGYLKRVPCKEDARGHNLVITTKGRNIRRKIWPVYARALQEMIADKLSKKETETLSNLLGKLY